jgi:hypothetical protein
MLVAMSVSYSHQAHYLVFLGTSHYAAWSIPGALDCLTFICVKVLATPAVVRAGRVAAAIVLAFSVIVSGLINFAAPGHLYVKLVFVAAVLLIPAAETVAAKVKPDFKAMDEMERSIAPVEVPAVAVQAAPEAVAAAPVAPTVKPTANRPPRKGRPKASPGTTVHPPRKTEGRGVHGSADARRAREEREAAPVPPVDAVPVATAPLFVEPEPEPVA